MDFADAQRDWGAVGGLRGELRDDDVRHGAGDSAAALLHDEAGDEIVGYGRGVEVGAALEAMAGIGVQAVAARAGADGGGVEPCGFDEDVFGGLGDARVPAAHYSGECERLLLVGDDEVVGGEDVLGAVEELEFFSCPCESGDDGAFDLVEVEAVRGLAHGKPAEVGGVDRGGDLFLAEGGEVVGDEAGGGTDGDAANHAGGEAAAEVVSFDADGEWLSPLICFDFDECAAVGRAA